METNHINKIGIVIAALNLDNIRLSPLFSDILNLNIDIVVCLPKGKGIMPSESGILIIEQNSKGIYNALNSGISYISKSCTHYIVCGDDDLINMESLKKLTSMIPDLSENRIYSGTVYNEKESCIMRPKKGFVSYHLHKGLISEHSVGTLIPISLHNQFGYYSEDYKIASDCDFLMKLYRNDIIFEVLDLELGNYNGGGVSNSNASVGLLEMKTISHDLSVFASILQSLKYIKYRSSELFNW